MLSVCVKEHLTDCGIVVIHVLGEPLLGEPLLGHGLLVELDVSLCEEVVLWAHNLCVEKDLSVDPHLLGDCAQEIYYLTSVKLKGKKNCLRMVMKKRKKVKMMKRSWKSERTLNSRMQHGDDHGME